MNPTTCSGVFAKSDEYRIRKMGYACVPGSGKFDDVTDNVHIGQLLFGVVDR